MISVTEMFIYSFSIVQNRSKKESKKAAKKVGERSSLTARDRRSQAKNLTKKEENYLRFLLRRGVLNAEEKSI